MGKKLIIKGANFIANAIQDIDYSTTTLYSLLVTTNPQSANYGKIVENINFLSAKIAVPAGKSVEYFITNNGSIMTDVISGYILSTSNVPMTVNTTIPNIVGNEMLITSNNGYFTVTNNTSSTAYLYYVFRYSDIAEFDINGKTCYYAIVDRE